VRSRIVHAHDPPFGRPEQPRFASRAPGRFIRVRRRRARPKPTKPRDQPHHDALPRIARMRDPGAHSATAPNLTVGPSAPVRGAQAKPANAGARRLRADKKPAPAD
jgi:hypothetical protein